MTTLEQTLFYKRDFSKKVQTQCYITSLKVGDILRFFGSLYSDSARTHQVGNTVIDYKILSKTSSGVLIETSNKYTLDDPNGKGSMHFNGIIFSTNFNVVENVVEPYTTKPAFLALCKGTNSYKNSWGHSKYVMTGNGEGKIVLHITTI
jgi:hypothetical protein